MKSLFTSLLIALTILGTGVAAVAAENEYKIGTDDVLHIIVWDNKDLEQVVMVRPDGMISFPLAGEIRAQDLTVPVTLAFGARDRLIRPTRLATPASPYGAGSQRRQVDVVHIFASHLIEGVPQLRAHGRTSVGSSLARPNATASSGLIARSRASA